MRLLLLGHLGIGDHIVMNGLIHFLRKSMEGLEELCIMVPDDYRKQTILHMYEDFPQISFYFLSTPIDDDFLFKEVHTEPQYKEITFQGKNYKCINFGLHSSLRNGWLFPGLDWVESLYRYPLHLDASLRFSEFILPSNLSVATEKYETLLNRIKTSEYVIVHDDPSRDRFMNQGIFKKLIDNDKMSELPILYLGKNRYSYSLFAGYENPLIDSLLECNSLFDLYFILKHASACHLMDSSVACLIDCANIGGKLYVHDYMMPDTGKQFKRIPWVRVSTLKGFSSE